MGFLKYSILTRALRFLDVFDALKYSYYEVNFHFTKVGILILAMLQ